MPNPLTIVPHRPAVSAPLPDPQSGPRSGLQRAPRRGRRSAPLVVAGILCLLGLRAEGAPFDTLDAEQRLEVADRCLPYRYGGTGADPDAVRDCLVRSSATAPPELSLDERYALRQLCGTDADCDARERRTLAATDRVELERLPLDERDALRRACREVQDADGPVAWVGCLQDAVTVLQEGPVLDRRALSFASRRAALSVCTDREPSTYRRCLQETGMPVDTSLAAPPATPLAPGSTDGDGTPGAMGAAPDAGDGVPAIGAGSGVDADADAGAGADDMAPVEPDLPTRLRNSFDALDDTGRLLLFAAALLPLLLWLARRLTHGRRPAYEGDGFEERGHATLADRVRHDRDRDDAFDGFGDGFDDGLDDETLVTGPGPGPALWEAPPEQGLPERLRPAAADPFAERSRFEGEADRLFEDLDSAIGSDTAAGPAAAREKPEPPEPALPPGQAPPDPVSRHDGLERMSDDLMMASLDGSDDIEAAIAASAAASATASHAVPARPDERPIDAGTGTDVDVDGEAHAHTHARTHAHASETNADGVAVSDGAHPMREPAVSAFGHWLHGQPADEQLVHVVEFFVYWMAYGDKRYDDEARRTLLDDEGPAHDDPRVAAERAIKRWVLLEDTDAFVDAVRWMASNGSADQRRQTLELLIALLVTDAAPTPVQNTLLRFLADAFDIGTKGLQSLWTESFGAPLPPLPRVDRTDWWAAQDERALSERDARRVATYPAAPRHAARLGLPLRGPYEAARIRAASRLAIQRTEPVRFEALGERAQTLAARQLERIEQARDALLEESIA